MARGCTLNRILSFPSKVGSHESYTNYILSDKLQNLGVQVTTTFPCQFSSRPLHSKTSLCTDIVSHFYSAAAGGGRRAAGDIATAEGRACTTQPSSMLHDPREEYR